MTNSINANKRKYMTVSFKPAGRVCLQYGVSYDKTIRKYRDLDLAWCLFSVFPSLSIMSHCCPPKTHFFQQFRYPNKAETRTAEREKARED